MGKREIVKHKGLYLTFKTCISVAYVWPRGQDPTVSDIINALCRCTVIFTQTMRFFSCVDLKAKLLPSLFDSF